MKTEKKLIVVTMVLALVFGFAGLSQAYDSADMVGSAPTTAAPAEAPTDTTSGYVAPTTDPGFVSPLPTDVVMVDPTIQASTCDPAYLGASCSINANCGGNGCLCRGSGGLFGGSKKCS